MDRTQAVNRFVRNNVRILLTEGSFPEDLYKKTKREYFSIQLNSTVGTPKDAEVADECVKYLLKTGQIRSREKLDYFLQLPFLKAHIREIDAYVQYLDFNVLGKSTVGVDPAQIGKQEYLETLQGQLRQKVVEEETEAIKKQIEEKKREYNSLPSVLDRGDFLEPVQEAQITEDRFLPWWKRLGLTADPFPSEVGLQKIARELYETVVYKSNTFKQYLYYADSTPSELFKNTIFFGQFGSGKTTLFEYLQYALIDHGIHGLYIQLHGEPDAHSFRIRFQDKLLDELCEIYASIKGTNPKSWLSTTNNEQAIVAVMKDMRGKSGTADFIVFVDDLHKDRENFPTAMTFVSTLQTFRDELVRKNPEINVAFYIAGSLEWEAAIKIDPRYSGSFSTSEEMPLLTSEAAKEMLDRRFEAFAPSFEGRRTVDIERIKQIQRYLQSNHLSLTYREFIKAVISEFRDGKFDLLTANPIQIPQNRLVEIETYLNSDAAVRASFDALQASVQKTETRQRTIDVLVRTYFEKEISEDSNYFKGNVFYFKRLLEAGLIQKLRRAPTGFVWVVSNQLLDKNKEIRERYDLSMEDYLPQIYGGRIAKTGKSKSVEEEIERIQFFLRSPAVSSEVKPFLTEALRLHDRIITDHTLPDDLEEANKLVNSCKRSLALLTKAALVTQAVNPSTLDEKLLFEWWSKSWHPMEEVSEFINVSNDRNRKPGERASRSRSMYRQAFSEIFNFVKNQSEGARLFAIPLRGLTNDEIRELNEIREFYISGKYFDATEKVTKLDERKLRLFLFNIFRILYGEDMYSRMKRLNTNSRKNINDDISKSKEKGFSIGRNEFEQLNRTDYKAFMVPDGEPIATQNWKEVFSKVFAPLTQVDVKDFLDKFANFNIQVGHLKDSSITVEQQTRVLDYIQRSHEFIRKLNDAYLILLTTGLSKGSNAGDFYLSFDKGLDKAGLKPIFVDTQTAMRLGTILAEKRSVEVNTEDWSHIEQYYSLPYPIFMAFISRLMQQSSEELEHTKVKIQLGEVHGPLITFTVNRLTAIKTKLGPRLFTEDELKEFLTKS